VSVNQWYVANPQFTNLKFFEKETTGKPVAKKEGKYIDSNTGLQNCCALLV